MRRGRGTDDAYSGAIQVSISGFDPFLGDAGFYRVRAHGPPGFNGRSDRVLQIVRADSPEVILLEAFPLLSSTVTEWPYEAALRVALRVSGGTVIDRDATRFGRCTRWTGRAKKRMSNRRDSAEVR